MTEVTERLNVEEAHEARRCRGARTCMLGRVETQYIVDEQKQSEDRCFDGRARR